eukprot:4786225-Pleurochrysis_carterae.AAC.3
MWVVLPIGCGGRASRPVSAGKITSASKFAITRSKPTPRPVTARDPGWPDAPLRREWVSRRSWGLRAPTSQQAPRASM